MSYPRQFLADAVVRLQHLSRADITVLKSIQTPTSFRTDVGFIRFKKDGTVDTYYSGQGTYSIDENGVFKIDISVIHGTGTYNEDGSIDFNTTDTLSYHYIPESERPETEKSTEDSFNATHA